MQVLNNFIDGYCKKERVLHTKRLNQITLMYVQVKYLTHRQTNEYPFCCMNVSTKQNGLELRIEYGNIDTFPVILVAWMSGCVSWCSIENSDELANA